MNAIYQSALQCSRLFEGWQSTASAEDDSAKITEGRELADLENSLFRFTLWADHYSVMSRGRDSLDWRLRKSEVTHSVVLDLMEDLAHAISVKMGLQAASEGDANNDPDLVLDQLFRYSKAIRRSGALRRLAKATEYAEYDEETGINLTEKFREAADQYLRVALGQVDNNLHGRLLDTICIRQQSFAFQRSRRENKQASVGPETDTLAQTPRASSRAGSGFGVRSAVAGTTRSVSKTSKPLLPRKRTGAPASEATTFVSNASQVPNREPESGLPSITFELEELPVRPKILPGEKERECPYCFTICPATDFTESGWPLHIVRDLMPFVCTLENCDSPNFLYTSINAWSSHMRNAHARKGWICMDPDHESPLHFLRLEDFKTHIGSEHETGIGDRELDLIAEECFEVLHEDTLAGPCPFPCAVDLDSMVNREREEHIAKHLISLAQKSLMDYDPIGPLDYGSAAGISSRFGSDSAQIKDSLNDRIEFTKEEDNTQDSQDSSNTKLSEDLVHSNEIEIPSPAIPDWNRICDHIRTQSTRMDYSLSSDPILKGFVERHENMDSDVEDISYDLRMLIMDNLVRSGFEKTPHRFLPEGVIDEIVTEENISMQFPSPDDDKILDYIRIHAKKIFAILIYIRPHNMRSALNWWRRKDMSDRDLPFSIQTAWKKHSWFIDFQEGQWTFLAPIFSTASYNHELDKEHILPFISREADAVRGSFGVVSKYTIHNKHLDPALSDHSPIAVKEIQPSDDAQENAEHWEREVKALRMMNELNQDHIVRFITAFRRRRERDGPDHYLIFEWADGGNLRSMWKREHSPTLTAALVKDAMFQILGLARALEAAHSVYETGATNRHGDIKPENILCFSNGGAISTLKIGDWGQTQDHGQVGETYPSKTIARFGTRMYEAPEVETGVRAIFLGRTANRRPRLYDIWAMGCITLEFTIWLLKGYEELTRFHHDLDKDSFYEISIENGKKVAHVHTVVTLWMDRLAEDPRCQAGSTAIGDLLELVRTSLLVVKLPTRLSTYLSEQPERSRTDSAISGASLDAKASPINDPPFHMIGVPDVPPATGIPSISLTPAEAEPEETPIRPVLEHRDPVRCLAVKFRSRMEDIVAEDPDEDEGYWLTV